jgi:hypothetical protein
VFTQSLTPSNELEIYVYAAVVDDGLHNFTECAGPFTPQVSI